MTVPNTRPKVADDVFATLLGAILGGRYAAGEKLPGQRALARDLGVTMTALREGLKRLEQMGLVDVRHGVAMRVNDVRERGTLDVLAPLLMRGGRLDPDVLADVFEARTLMLTELGALAAERRDDAQAGRLSALADAIARAPGDRAAQELDFAWATELAHAAGNLVFVLILNAIRAAYFANADALPVTADHAGLAPLYERAADAVAARDGDGARAAMLALALAQRERVEARRP
ncbi:FadR/GntR family transcriptional regulator [Capillimicrobium parvum]|uniref:HTH-type transcriptional regulator Mce2R n=1 Tax=Capillimicrobium parvum TaxID=2884022 RepID=A0A9E6XWH3_9ACTN|nr:GntR family transcriptional regulator [Capillimicrobium parvum]UGS35688.1 HTH-type transcriptional regulator Mce2R [Capillimicrobium parvum]